MFKEYYFGYITNIFFFFENIINTSTGSLTLYLPSVRNTLTHGWVVAVEQDPLCVHEVSESTSATSVFKKQIRNSF
jgi:hypothetical protein